MALKKDKHAGLKENFHKKRVLYSGVVDFRADTVTLPNGKMATRAFMAHPGAVAVLPVLDDGRVVLVRQYRYPVAEATLEIPAGKLNSVSDKPLGRVKAELKEETGYTAASIKPLITFWPTTAFSNEVLHIYTASGLRGGIQQNLDEDEFVNVEIMPFEKALGFVKRGVIKDAKTIIALQAWKIKLLEKK
ncbi:MAG: NUDIX hydrolase [Elusimicrobiales bacterium]|nr:NUDIX hydrolase [Elusimicrobiales bacterium]